MLTAKFVELYGWVSLAIMAIVLGLMWIRVIPESLYLVMFIMATCLFLGRIVLRLALVRQDRKPKQQAPEL